jgi:transcriptional regulator with XRE-family HTH domain
MENLRTVRKNSNLTLQNICELTGLTTVTLNMAEQGNQVPNPTTRKRLEQIFGQRINWLDTPYINVDPLPIQGKYQVERSFRTFIRMANSLRDEDKKVFIETCIKHLKTLIS